MYWSIVRFLCKLFFLIISHWKLTVRSKKKDRSVGCLNLWAGSVSWGTTGLSKRLGQMAVTVDEPVTSSDHQLVPAITMRGGGGTRPYQIQAAQSYPSVEQSGPKLWSQKSTLLLSYLSELPETLLVSLSRYPETITRTIMMGNH